MSLPDNKEAIVLPEGVEKVTYQRDLKLPGAGTFTIGMFNACILCKILCKSISCSSTLSSMHIAEREDHTLGNMVRSQLLQDEHVRFAGYQIPHPLEHQLHVRVHTSNTSSPPDAIKASLNQLLTELDSAITSFQSERRRWRIDA